MRRSITFAMALALSTSMTPAFAQQGDVKELKRELDELRDEVSQLRYVLSEVVRLDRRRTEALERALRIPGSKAAAPVAAVKPKIEKPRPRSLKKVAKTRPATRAPSPRRAAGPASVGTVTGKVRVPSGEPVAYVYIENVRGRLARGRSVTIEQSGKQFRPRWAVVEKGTTVKFPNEDNVFHNVFSRSPGNTFDLGLYRKGEGSKSHRFNRAGPADVYCNIHPKMSASILVVPNKLFAKVRPDGTYTIEGVPDGKRKVVAWAPGSSSKSAWVDVQNGQVSSLDLALKPRSKAHKNKLGRPYGSYQ